ncbi:MAG: Ig-like domain-containing protein, partial [Eubacterium sp.]|uniref:Ig-like domain-containing protein n=1 Tax=Eubacterium sp. TaxID=142586 RepID=UPI00399B9AA6
SKSEDGKLTLSANQVSLYSGDTKQVTVNDNATWSSKSEFVAEVSEDGIIKGNHVGKTIITATSDNGEALCEVVVNAKYSTYTEPVLEFGVDKATVKAKEKRTILEDKTSTLGYRGENSAVKSVAYLFENGKLTSSAIALSYSYTENNKFLSRYQVIGRIVMVHITINNDSDKYNMGLDYPLKVVSLWWCMFLSLLNHEYSSCRSAGT